MLLSSCSASTSPSVPETGSVSMSWRRAPISIACVAAIRRIRAPARSVQPTAAQVGWSLPLHRRAPPGRPPPPRGPGPVRSEVVRHEGQRHAKKDCSRAGLSTLEHELSFCVGESRPAEPSLVEEASGDEFDELIGRRAADLGRPREYCSLPVGPEFCVVIGRRRRHRTRSTAIGHRLRPHRAYRVSAVGCAAERPTVLSTGRSVAADSDASDPPAVGECCRRAQRGDWAIDAANVSVRCNARRTARCAGVQRLAQLSRPSNSSRYRAARNAPGDTCVRKWSMQVDPAGD